MCVYVCVCVCVCVFLGRLPYQAVGCIAESKKKTLGALNSAVSGAELPGDGVQTLETEMETDGWRMKGFVHHVSSFLITF